MAGMQEEFARKRRVDYSTPGFEVPHYIEAHPTEAGMFHRCVVCGATSIGNAPELPCPGEPQDGAR